MPADVSKIISGNVVKEGGAVAVVPTSSLGSGSIVSVHYGDFPLDDFAAKVSKKFKYKNYYDSSESFSADSGIDTAIAATGVDTMITYAADAYGGHVINGVGFSYSGGAPTAGNLSVEVPSGSSIYSTYIAGSGQGTIIFPDPIRGSGNTSMNVRLSAGGASIVGQLNVFGHRVE